jgi:hypothetical protein
MFITKKTTMALPESSVAKLYHRYRRVSGGGADGRVMGVNGSINPLAVFGMLMAMKVEGRTVFDFGCSEGRFLLAAALQGARKAIGVEFPENKGYQYLFDAVRKSMQRSCGVLPAEWLGRNIDMVTASCPDFSLDS